MASPLWIRWLVTAALLTAFAARVYALEDLPAFVALEEADHGIAARQILAGEVPNPFALGRQGQPNTSFFPFATSMFLYGDRLGGLRMGSVAVGMASIAIGFVFARDLMGWRAALLATLVLGLLPAHVHFSRIGLNNLQGVLALQLAMVVLWRAWAAGPSSGFAVAGVASATGLYTYLSGRLVIVLVPAALAAFAAVARERAAGVARGAALWVVGLVLGSLPMLAWYLEHPGTLVAQTEDVSILTPRNFQALLAGAGGHLPLALGDHLVQVVKGIAYSRDACPSYGGGGGLLGPVAFTFAILGVLVAAVRIRQPRYALLLTWLMTGTLFAGLLTARQPYVCRLIVLLPPLSIGVALGALQLATWLPRRLAYGLVGLLLAALAYQLFPGYMVDYRQSDYPHQRPGTDLARAVALFEKEAEVVVAGPPYADGAPVATFFGARRQPRDLPPGEPFIPPRTTILILAPQQRARLDQLQALPRLRVEPRPFPSEHFTVWLLQPLGGEASEPP